MARNAFENEDEPMIRACQDMMGTTDLFSLKPVLLKTDVAAVRSDRDTGGADVEGLLKPCPAEGWEARPVSTRVNSPKNDDQDCIASVTEEPT